MRKLLAKARTRIGYAAVGVLLTLAAGGVATAAVMAPATDEVSDVSTVTSPAETTEPQVDVTEPTVATTTEAPVDSPVAEVPAATVEDVPAPETTPKPPAPDVPEGYDPAARFTDSSGTVYQPAPDVPVEKLPGEPGYVPPTGG